MTQRIVTVTECPYCNAGVYLKAQAIIDTKGLDVEKFICLDEQPDQQVAIYDRCRPDSPPCPHLYLLQGSGEQLEEYPTRDICLDFSC